MNNGNTVTPNNNQFIINQTGEYEVSVFNNYKLKFG